MTDFALQTLPDGTMDLVMLGGDLARDDSIRSAVFVSLLTDREWVDAPDGDRRGWWGDVLNADPADRIGAWLWRLNKAKKTPATLAAARQYAEAAMAWMVADGIASAVTVAAAWDARHLLMLDIDVARPTGVLRFRLAELWLRSVERTAIEVATASLPGLQAQIDGLEFIYYTQYPEFGS